MPQHLHHYFITILLILLPFHYSYSQNTTLKTKTHQGSKRIDELCQEIGNKLGSVNIEDCLQQALLDSGYSSIENRALAYKEYPPLKGKQPLGRVLFMGGIHGDEYSAISTMFKWMDKLNQYHSGLFHWTVIPVLNPDGLLQKKSQRQNSKGIDLNRNFPSKSWNKLALKYWQQRTGKNPRRYPGPHSLSEPESQWFVKVINEFKPDAIIAVHAPHSLIDFDGPHRAPRKLGSLHLRLLGTYPGSLGNYAGVDLGIPVVTVELASAGIMPSNKEIGTIWIDIVRWLRSEVPKSRKSKLNK